MPTILLVDDQPLFRENLAEALEEHGFGVVQADSARQALECCRNLSPDLLLLDIALPETNGLELLEQIRTFQGLYGIPAVFLTAYPRENYLEESHRLGASDFLVKSDVSLQDLLRKIERRLDPSLATNSSTPPTSYRSSDDEDEDEKRRHLRPALRRWKPTAPHPAVARLFALACKPEIVPQDIAQLAALDPELTTILLEAASSGPFRGAPGIIDVNDALERIGTTDAMHLLLTRVVLNLAGKGIPASGDLVRLWGHAIATGLFAERLSAPTSFPAPLAGFLAGLCSELSSVFGILALEDDYTEIRAQAWEEAIPIQKFLADVFETSPAHLALECSRALELPESVWKAVVDLQAGFTPTSLWEPGPASRVLEGASALALGVNQIWNPCVPIRTISWEESRWWRDPEELEADLPGIVDELRKLLQWEDVLPELGGQTQALPSGEDRRFLYLRSATIFLPDPIESLLRELGDVELVHDPERFLRDGDAVRVAAAEPSTPLWNRLLEIPRKTVLLHRTPLPPDARLGPHSEITLPATVTALEGLLRPR